MSCFDREAPYSRSDTLLRFFFFLSPQDTPAYPWTHAWARSYSCNSGGQCGHS